MSVPHRKSRVAPPPEECPLTECLSIIGGAWTPNVVWYLRGGSRRFGELKSDIVGISPRMLTERLRRLEAEGVVSRTVVPSSPPTVHYELTALGRELIPAVDAIVDVGRRLKAVRSRAAARSSVRTMKS